MKQLFIDSLLTDRAARAICWTLIHSIWQGVLAAALAAVVIACTRRVKASIRYNLLTLILLLLVTATSATFLYQLSNDSEVSFSVDPVHGPLLSTIVANEIHSDLPKTSNILGVVGDYLNEHASIVAGLWLLCLTFQLVRLTGGLYQMRRFRRKGIHPPGIEWVGRLATLCRVAGVRKKVLLLQSELVSMPVTFGFLKPTILIPFGMIAGLPADQLETILLHELAHIRRNDYLSNLLLYITESVFFFNPAFRWMASRIRQEREACCDDIVLSETHNRNNYFDALIAFRVQAMAQQGYPLQLGIGKTDLLWRIRRMLDKENKKLHVMEKALLSVGLMIVLAIGLVSMNEWQAPPPSVTSAPAEVSSDTTPAIKVPYPSISKSSDIEGARKTCKISATDAEGNTFQLTKTNGEITEMIINGNVLSPADYDRYEYIFDKIERHREARENAQSDEATEATEQVEATEATEVAEATETTEATEATEAPEATETTEVTEAPAPPSASDRWIHRIIKDLARNGIIANEDPLSFTLDKDHLIVNGVRQPDDVYRLFKEKYIANPKDHFDYSRDGGSTHVEVWVE